MRLFNRSKRLISGQVAPSFATHDVQGEPISLENFRGHRLLLSFIRFAGCPFCSLRTYYLSLRYPELRRAGFSVVAVLESSNEQALKQPVLREAPFPIVADPQQTLYRLYRVESSEQGALWALRNRKKTLKEARERGFDTTGDEAPEGADPYRLPAEFLIGPDQRIERAHYGKDIGDYLSIESLQSWLPENATHPATRIVFRS